jgi:hypothetical protein
MRPRLYRSRNSEPGQKFQPLKIRLVLDVNVDSFFTNKRFHALFLCEYFLPEEGEGDN